MQVFSWVYVLTAFAFLFLPELLRTVINWDLTLFPSLAAMPVPVEGFWRVMSGAMVAMLVLLSRAAARDPDNREYAIIHLVSKLVSTFGFAALLYLDKPMIAYAVGIMTDLPIALALIAFLYTWSGPSRGTKKARTA